MHPGPLSGSTVSPWASHSTPLNLRFLLHKVGLGPPIWKDIEIVPSNTQSNANTAVPFPPALPKIFSQRPLELRDYVTLSPQRTCQPGPPACPHPHTTWHRESGNTRSQHVSAPMNILNYPQQQEQGLGTCPSLLCAC